LLIASYVFYGAWDWRFLFLILASTVVDFFAAARIEASDFARTRRGFLVLSLAVNLGILGFFKYLNFGIESLAVLLTWIGLEPHLSTLQIILPVGISFYTFQTISYTVDVYRGE
jgi:alginate O-acetyltransferase complex protein AlgI